MLFTSISFIYYFLPLVLLFYSIVPKKYKNLVLLIFSFIFYFYGEAKYVFLMFFEILISYFGAILIDKHKKDKELSKNIFIITIFIHIFLLVIFKYTNFIIDSINNIAKLNISFVNIALPIGISFYTFQVISYVTDVYKGKVEVQKSFIKLATYVSLFPQLVAGPIVRYDSIKNELDERSHSIDKIQSGILRFIIGLSKKILIANVLGEVYSNLGIVNDKSILLYWVMAISYMLEIYFDFSGYSDMAIGLGKIFGFSFPENFNYPYISKSITEFWRRWHITLGSFFRDYVYIPLGGNRCSKIKFIRNILIVWSLTGIWHGASYNFILWGLLFGIILLIEKLFLNKLLSKIPNIFRHIYVLVIVMMSFIIFSNDDISIGFNNIISLFKFNTLPLIDNITIYYIKENILVFIIAILGSLPLCKNIIIKLKENNVLNNVINVFEIIFIISLLIICTSFMIDSSYNPFLYFRF